MTVDDYQSAMAALGICRGKLAAGFPMEPIGASVSMFKERANDYSRSSKAKAPPGEDLSHLNPKPGSLGIHTGTGKGSIVPLRYRD